VNRALIALVLVVGLAACSGTDDAGQSTSPVATTAPDTSTATAAVAPTTTEVQQAGELPPEALGELGPTEAPETGGESTGPLGQTRLDIDTGEGSLQIGVGEIPASAAEFPLPADLVVELASETSDATGFSGTSQGSVQDLADFYRESLPEAGFTVVEERTPTTTVVLIEFESPTVRGDLALSGAPGGAGTTVIVTLTPTA
jgi:hypothetical protein